MIKNNKKEETNSRKESFAYSPALLKKYESGWIIEFKYYHPESKELIKHRIKVQRERLKINSDRLSEIEFLKRCKSINKNLADGWTPIGSLINETEEENLTIIAAFELYFKKNKEYLRADSERSYRSVSGILVRWMDEKGKKNMTLSELNIKFFIQFQDYLIEERGIANRTFNRYIGFLRAIFNWLKRERQLDFINPFAGIKKKKEKKPNIIILPDEWLNPVIEYCQKNNPVFEMVINMIYTSFIRPLEICRCKIKNIDLKNKVIHLDDDETKMDVARTVILKDYTIKLMIENGIGQANPNDYLIGKRTGENGAIYIGSKTPTHTRALDRNWNCMRISLNMPQKYRLYPFKHKGITFLRTLGYSREDISTITGHSCPQEIDTYTMDTARVEIAKRISNEILSIDEIAKNMNQIKK